MENKITTGYNVVTITSGQKEKFPRITGDIHHQRIDKFYTEELKIGNDKVLQNKSELIVIDEIEKLELEGKGWSDSLQQIINDSKSHLLLSVREEVISEIIEKFKFTSEIIFNVSEKNSFDLYLKILNNLQKID